MLSLGSSRIYLRAGPTDMRKSFDGLSALVRNAFPSMLLTGSLFVFVNRRRNHLKAMYWDDDGFVIFHKRLERGTFRVKWAGDTELSRREFMLLFEGVVPRRLNRRFSLPD